MKNNWIDCNAVIVNASFLLPSSMHIIEREGVAQRKCDGEMKSRSSSLSSSHSPAVTGASAVRHVTSGSDERGDYREVVEEKGEFVFCLYSI